MVWDDDIPYLLYTQANSSAFNFKTRSRINRNRDGGHNFMYMRCHDSSYSLMRMSWGRYRSGYYKFWEGRLKERIIFRT